MAIIEQKTTIEIAISWILAACIALILTGYPLAGALSALFGVESTVTSHPFRAISSFLLIILSVLSFARMNFTVDIYTIIFLFLYGIRLFYDATYTSLPDAADSGIFYLVVVVLPFIAISLGRMYYDERRSLIAMVLLCFPTMIILLILGRQNSNIEVTGRLGFDSLNPVSIGYLGLYAVISSALLWPRLSRFYRYAFLLPTIVIGAYLMIQASARGPIVGLVLCLAAVAVRRGSVLICTSGILVVGALLFGDYLADLALFQRIAATGSDVSSMERFDRAAIALELMVEHPFYGYGYIDPFYYSFPHNLVIESGMALGVGGFIAMILLQVRYGKLIWSFLSSRQYYAPMIGLIGLSSAWISSTLWASVTFWTPLILLVALASERQIDRGPRTSKYQNIFTLALRK